MTSLTPAAILAHIRVPPRTADTPTKLYTGVCHCGRFEFECRHPIVEDGFEVVSCNCSICKQRGYLIMYILDPANDFKFVKGERSDLLEYKFNRQALNHMSCPTCASALFIEYNLGPVFLISVNARSIRDLDVQKLTLKMRG